MPKIKVLIADDQTLFRQGLHVLLSLEPEIEIIGEADNGLAALHLTEALWPDVVLMDAVMPVMDGVVATQRIKASRPDSRVLILTSVGRDAHVFEGLRRGAMGYLPKDSLGEHLIEAIQRAARGEMFLPPPAAAEQGGALSKYPALTPREQEVLGQMAAGKSNLEIAGWLVITEQTVKNYISAIFNKLKVKNRSQAARRARELGLL